MQLKYLFDKYIDCPNDVRAIVNCSCTSISLASSKRSRITQIFSRRSPRKNGISPEDIDATCDKSSANPSNVRVNRPSVHHTIDDRFHTRFRCKRSEKSANFTRTCVRRHVALICSLVTLDALIAEASCVLIRRSALNGRKDKKNTGLLPNGIRRSAFGTIRGSNF